jgi:hypothetical protein
MRDEMGLMRRQLTYCSKSILLTLGAATPNFPRLEPKKCGTVEAVPHVPVRSITHH